MKGPGYFSQKMKVIANTVEAVTFSYLQRNVNLHASAPPLANGGGWSMIPLFQCLQYFVFSPPAYFYPGIVF